MANELRIPVKLDVLQSSIGDLQKILNNLQPNTAGYKAIEKIIQSMVQESQKLQVQLSRPFTNEGQFRTANKTIEKLEDSAARISVIMNGLKFSDLKLTPEQQASFEKLNKEIDDIRTNYQQLTNQVKQSVLANSNNESLITNLLGSKTLSADFAQIRAEVDKHISELEEKQTKLQSTYEKLKSNADLASRAKILTSQEGGITRESIGQSLFDKYLWQNGDQMGFKLLPGQTKETFIKELEQVFNLDEGTLKDLASKSFNQINEAFQQMGQKGNMNPFQGLISAFGSNKIQGQLVIDKQNLGDLADQINQYKQLQIELNTLQNQKIDPADTEAQGRIAALTQEMSKLEDQILQTATSSPTVKKPLAEIGNQANYLKTSLEQCNAQFLRMQKTTQSFNQMKMAIVNFMGFSQVLNLAKRAIKDAVNHIRELDAVMNKISIVTDMSTSDLWDQVDAYSKMAQTYGVSIKGAYEVSQIYYQQGLATNDVLTLTNETLKLAKVSGLDYASTTDYMTTALRGFKMEMSEASTVVDVYSNLAAHTAVTQEELAVAMSKTASSMESVGSTFEESSAMIATMVAVTRESSVNIGSALKSIAARYGEMKKDPGALIDADGEVMAYNKVDAALQSVGISLKTADGQFREFTDVIIELGEKWEELDSVQQRYIATQFAGNRQQSRFLALVSNVDLLKSNLNYAENAEDTGTLQALKALDSVDSKLEQVRVAYQEFYTTIGAENVWKGLLDGTKSVINTLNRLPKLFGKLPVAAITVISNIVNLIKGLAFKGLTGIAQHLGKSFASGIKEGIPEVVSATQTLVDNVQNVLKSGESAAAESAKRTSTNYANNLTLDPSKLNQSKRTQYDQKQAAIDALTNHGKTNLSNEDAIQILQNAQQQGHLTSAQLQQLTADRDRAAESLQNHVNGLRQEQAELFKDGQAAQGASGRFMTFIQSHQKLGSSLTSLGYALNMIGALFNTADEGGRAAAASFMGVAGAAQLAGAAITTITTGNAPWMVIASGIISIINAVTLFSETGEEKLERLQKKAEELGNTAKQLKSDFRNLDVTIKKLDELTEKRYESEEAAEEYQSTVDDLAKKFPELIQGFDDAGNVIINTTDAENVLAKAREASAKATYDAAKAELDAKEQEIQNKKDELRDTLQNQNYTDNSEWRRTEYFYEKLTENYVKAGYDEDRAKAKARDVAIPGVITESQLLDYAEQYNIDLDDYYSNAGMLEEVNKLAQDMLALEDITSQQGLEYYDRIKALLRQIDPTELDTTTWGETINQLNSVLGEYEELLGQRSGLRKAVISAWQKNSFNKEGKSWKYTESSALSAMLTDRVSNQLDIVTDENGNKLEATEENYRKLAEEDQEALDTFYKFLNEDQVKQLEQMFSDTSNMGIADFEQAFGDTEGWNAQVYSILSDYYSEGMAHIQERLQNNLKTKAGYGKETEYSDIESELLDNDSYRAFVMAIGMATTTVEEQFLNKTLDQYQSMLNKGLTTQANDYRDSALELFGLVSSLGGELEKNVWSVIKEKGLNTVTGIQEIISTINNIPGLDDSTKQAIEAYLLSMSDNLSRNINLEIQTMTSELLEGWEDKSKDLSKALNGGVTLKEADSLIQQAKTLNLETPITLDDFQLVGDKLVLTREAYKRYYEGFIASNQAAIETLQEQLDQAKEADTDLMAKAGFKDEWSETYEKYLGIADKLGIKLTDYLEKDGSISEDGILAFQAAVAKVAEEIGYYNRAAAIAAEQLNSAEDRKHGEYKLEGRLLDKAALEEIASSTSLTLEGTDVQKRAIKESINSVYNTLISDVLSKGFDNVNTQDYEGLIKGTTLDSDEGYEEFVKKYINLTGKTTSEINDMVLQAREKDREQVKEDVVKDVTFVNDKVAFADEATLGELANTFDKSFTELIDSGAVKFNDTLQEYVLDIEALKAKGVNLTAVDNFKLAVQESIDTLFDAITSDISSALSGSLDVKGAKSLADNLSRLGVNIDLQFTRTTKGLKLAESSAIALYNKLRQINALQSELVFDELNKSLQETNEHYKTISAVMDRIAWIEDKKHPTRKDQYAEELALAKEILAVRSTTEDSSFDFMSNKIPGSQNNPIKYFESWGKAWSTLRDSFKGKGKDKGKIEYEDFYNIITEMGHIAEVSGKEIKLSATESVSNMEDAARLIDKGAKSLTVATDGSIKVDLSKFGLDFSSGATEMQNGVDKGIHEMARSQVEMLDSMIKLMETIVAMEKLGDVDVGGNGVIDFGEIFDVKGLDENSEKYYESINKFTKQWEESTKNLNAWLDSDEGKETKESLEAVKVSWGDTNASMLDLLKMKSEDVAGWTEEQKTTYAATMKAFYAAAKSGDFSEENIAKSIREVLAGTGFTGDIEVGEIKLTFHQGVALERDKEGNYVVGDAKFTDPNLAAQAMKAASIEPLKEAAEETQVDKETGAVTYTYANNVTVTVTCDAQGVYKAVLSNGDVITADSEKALQVGILTAVKLDPDVTLAAEEPVTFKYTADGQAELEITVDTTDIENPKVTAGKEDVTDEKLGKAALAAVQEQADSAASKVSGKTVTASADGVKIQLPAGATYEVDLTEQELTVDLSGKTIKGENAELTLVDPVARVMEGAVIAVQDVVNGLVDDSTLEVTIETEVDDFATDDLNVLKELAEEVETSDPNIDLIVNNAKNVETKLINIAKAALSIPASRSTTLTLNGEYEFTTALDRILEKIREIAQIWTVSFKTGSVGKLPVAPGNGGSGGSTSHMSTRATGTVGNARASGTLMGELGPELVVQQGRYFVAGQRGAEFVNLADDAIVFNHLQTRQLLQNGMSSTRGRAVTNERVAVAYAHGNVEGGPAKASASAALAALQQLKSMWEALESASVKDLAGKGGGGGGGGKQKNNAWITQVERWYNLMQKIAQLEKDITHEQTLRSKIQSDINRSGKAYFKSQVEELQALQQELVAQEALNISKQDYFNQRREQLNTDKNNPFNQLYQFDENGQLKYNDKLKIKGADNQTKTGAFNFLSDLMSQAPNGKAKYTSEQQYNALLAAGFGDYMKYNQNSEELPTKNGKPEDYAAAVEAFWDAVEAQKEEMQTLHDDIEEGNNKTLELQQKQNEILQEMRDNQMSVENAVLKAIESQRQRAIDKLSDERKALEESSQKYIQGLSDALSKERDLYNQNESSEELNKMRRQLAILQRSGGSGADIRNLQSQINSTERDLYFEEQQRQIDAIQEASDKQLEKMQTQIDLMTETLEYQKTFGLLWADVYQIMNENSAQNIAAFIQANDKELWGNSPLKTTEEMRTALFQAEQWTSLRECQDNMFADQQMANDHQEETISAAVYGTAARDWPVFDEAMSLVYGKTWDKQAAKYEEKFGAKVSQSQDITDAREQITGALNNLTTAVTGALPKPSSISGVSGSGSNSGGSSNSNTGGNKQKNHGGIKSDTYVSDGSRGHHRHIVYKDDTKWDGPIEKHTWPSVVTNGTKCTKCGWAARNYSPGSATTQRLNQSFDVMLASGGMVNKPTNALVGEKGIEAVLNPEQTKILRENILSNKPNSLISLLETYNAAYNNGITPAGAGENIVIENVSVNMNVSEIANDYDARRAGAQALDEMLNIARKTSARNSIRR